MLAISQANAAAPPLLTLDRPRSWKTVAATVVTTLTTEAQTKSRADNAADDTVHYDAGPDSGGELAGPLRLSSPPPVRTTTTCR